MAHMAFGTAGGIWPRQGFMNAIPIAPDVSIACFYGLRVGLTMLIFLLDFLNKVFPTIVSQRLIQADAIPISCDFSYVLADVITIDNMMAVSYVI